MPNPFPSLLLRASGGRDVLADCTDDSLAEIWPSGAHGEYIGTVADLAASMWPAALAVDPVAVQDPFTAAHWSHFTNPSDLWYVAHGVARASFGGSIADAGKPCAIAWRFAPSTSSGVGSVSISIGGVTSFSQSFSAGSRFTAGVWWVPDSLWDAATWQTVAVTVSGSCAAAAIAIPYGALVPGDLPAGWDAPAMPPRSGPECQRANVASPDYVPPLGDYLDIYIPPASIPATPVRALRHAAISDSSFYGTNPIVALMRTDQTWDADGMGPNPGLGDPLPNGATTDWSRRFFAHRMDDTGWTRTQHFPKDLASGFPLIYHPASSVFKEALNLPHFDGPPFKPAVPGYIYGSGVQVSRGQVQATAFDALNVPAGDIATTRTLATFWPGAAAMALVCVPYGGYSAGDHVDVVIYEWQSGTVLHSSSVALTGGEQVIPLSVADPGLADGATWEVSAVLNFYVSSTSSSVAGIALQPVYHPLPWNAPGADGASMVPGGTTAAMLRDPTGRTLSLSATAAPGATSATVTVPANLADFTLWETGPTPHAFFFTPAAGWYSASAAANASPTSATAYALGDEDFIPLGSVAPIAPAYPGRAFSVVATGTLKDQLHPSGSTQITASITRFSPSPQSIPTDGSWLKLTIAQGAGWASFTAPSAGHYVIQAAYHNGSGSPNAANRQAPLFCWFAGTDADVIVDAVQVHAWSTPMLSLRLMPNHDVYVVNGPSDIPSLNRSAFVVGESPTGILTGRSGELFYRWREWPSDPWQYRFYKPFTGLVALDYTSGFAARGYDGTGWKQEWPEWSGDLDAGQTIYFRVHGTRSADAQQHGGVLTAQYYFLRLLLP